MALSSITSTLCRMYLKSLILKLYYSCILCILRARRVVCIQYAY